MSEQETPKATRLVTAVRMEQRDQYEHIFVQPGDTISIVADRPLQITITRRAMVPIGTTEIEVSDSFVRESSSPNDLLPPRRT